ncbi:MAG: hemerythrin domain-containing protein [Pseudomonadota bacterium]|nr:hemerythrin domain-containing protein [Pseudomonadota bacterium]
MKRIPALQNLSREHQPALVLAAHAKRFTMMSDPALLFQFKQKVIDQFQGSIEPHFQLEEKYLLPALEQVGELAVAKQTREEHENLRNIYAGIWQAEASVIAEFGKLLAQHIRFEESVVFEIAQSRLKATQLDIIRRASVDKG